MFLALLMTLGADPQFVVVNKCPPAFSVVNKVATPAVVAAPTFRNGSYHAGHACPNCGRTQFVIESGRKGGTHTHRCAADGTVWFH